MTSSSTTSINSATHSSVANAKTPDNANTPATTPSTAGADKSSALELESKEIGWSFVQYYYNLFSSNPREVYKLYAPNATVAHDDFDEFLTEEHPALVNVEAKGTEEIKSKIFNFTADENQDNVKHKFKIVVNSADIHNLNMFGDLKTILIVVVGELARGDSPAFSFAQTFVINQSNKNVYDIVNDVMRIIPLEDENEKEFVAINKEPAAKEVKEGKHVNYEAAHPNSTPASAAAAEAGEGAPSTSGAAAKEDSKTSTPDAVPTVKQDVELKSVADKKAGKEDESTATSTADVSTAATSSVSTPDKKDGPKFSQDSKQATYSSKKIDEKKSKELFSTELEELTSANPASPAAEKPISQPESKGPTSWAARAAKKGTEPVKKQVITTPPISKPAASKPHTTTEPVSGKDDGFDLVKNKKIKKSFKLSSAEVYPVYIRGISEKLTTEELTAKLESNFGDVFSCVVKNFVALVDFKTARAQEQALKTRTVSIDGKFDITIEPRTTKGNDKEGKHFKKDGKSNGKKFINANNKKPAGKFQKAKKDVEKN